MKNVWKYFLPDVIELFWMIMVGVALFMLGLISLEQNERIKDLEVIVNAQQLLDNLEQPLDNSTR